MRQRIHHNLQPIHQSGQKKVQIPARTLQNLAKEPQRQYFNIKSRKPEQDTYAQTCRKTKLLMLIFKLLCPKFSAAVPSGIALFV